MAFCGHWDIWKFVRLSHLTSWEFDFPGNLTSREIWLPRKFDFPGNLTSPGSHLSWRVTSPGKSNFSGKSHKTNVGMSKYPNVRKIPYMLRRYQWLHELNDTDGWTDAEMLQHVDQTASKFAAGKNTIWCFGNTKPTHFESKTNYLKMCFGKYSLFVPFPNYINSK